MELAVIGSGKTLSVSDAVFGREFREDLVHQVVVAYRNAGRAGTKAQKTRSEVTRHHQEVQEAEGRRRAPRRLPRPDLRRRRRDVRGQAAQLRAEGQPQDVPRRDAARSSPSSIARTA